MAEQGEFRDHLGNVTDQGKRVWLYPKIIKGKLYRYRVVASWVLLFFLFSGPWWRVNGHPLFLFNVVEGQFVLFGKVFWPHDFSIIAFFLLTALVFIVLFTVLFGRVWCGWACPQTIFMEMVFRKIEVWIEGSPAKRKKLDQMPWNTQKILKKGSKHGLFLIISFFISNTFLAYIIGSDQLLRIISEPLSQHWKGFLGITVFTVVFYLVFAKLRELVCIMICPYGRLQGVMLDRNSLVVIYDLLRGEPRGKIRKKENQEAKGDCIDCNLCVDVCPTGIDIRNGTQLECVNCTMCIDACNSVMKKINKPEGLIRIDSTASVEDKKKWKWTPRVIAYLTFLLVMTTVATTMMVMRKDIQTTVIRSRGSLYNTDENGTVTNLFNAEFVNKTFEEITLEMKSENESIQLELIDESIRVPSGGIKTAIFLLKMKQEDIRNNRTPVTIKVFAEGKILDEVNTKFLGPVYE